MSYILDALKRADANRQQSVPDLYSRTGVADTERTRRRRGWHPAWLWLAAALLVAASFGALWSMMRASSRPTASTPVVARAVSPVTAPVQAEASVAKAANLPAALPAAGPKAPSASANVSPAKAPAMPTAPSPPKPTVKPSTPLPQTQASAPAQKPPTSPLAVVVPKPLASVAAPASAPATSAPTKPTVAPTMPPPQPPPLYAALNPEMKGQMPVLLVGGSVYSAQASARMVVINGVVLREGDRVAPELTVESIGAKTSTLNWRGSRFQLPH